MVFIPGSYSVEVGSMFYLALPVGNEPLEGLKHLTLGHF